MIDALPTPALVVDVAAADANLALAARQAAGLPIRPHFKAHRCVPLLRRQLAAPGHRGVTCATAEEALTLAREGIGDLLVANEVVDPTGLAELAAAAWLLAGHATRGGPPVGGLTVAVDSRAGLDALAAALRDRRDRAEGAPPPVGVLVDVDVGQRRCGLAPGDPAIVALAQAAAQAPTLRFAGLMGYDGHAQHGDAAARQASTARVATVLRAERERLEAAGLAVETVSGGGSGTLADVPAAGALTEIQAGSYVLLDVEYGDLGLGFRRALTCVTTVVSRRGDVAVLNAGLKALSAEHGLPAVLRDDATVTGISDEHLNLRLDAGSTLTVGDRVALVPHHVDPTMSLHDTVFAADGDAVEPWPVAGRSSAGARWRRATGRDSLAAHGQRSRPRA